MIFYLLACDSGLPKTVELSGVVFDAPYLLGDTVAGETLTVLSVDGAEAASGSSGEDGSFTLEVEAAADFYLRLEGDHPTTTFSGTTGYVDLESGTGVPWTSTQTWVEQIPNDFANCPSVATPGGIVVGEIRIYLDGIAPWDSPVGSNATVKITGSDGEAAQTCYLADDGTSIEYGESVGATGRFAAFGLPEGPLLVGVSYVDGSGATSNNLYRGWLATDGVAPFYPIFVPSGI